MVENMTIENILYRAVENGASDVFLIAGRAVSYRKNGTIHAVGEERLMPQDTERLVREIYALAEQRSITQLEQRGDDDFAFAVKGCSRFRVSAYKQRGSYSCVIRVITFELPNPGDLNIPEAVINLCRYNKGMVLVTGTAGSGKSTTLACMIHEINRTRDAHIITLEDPIEYLHRHDRSIVSQREINIDTENYVTALRAALRQSPDVILLGEMRDYETIEVAMTAAETGHLLLSTLHTLGAASTIDRIIDVFPASQQRQIAIQLSTALHAVVSQQLLPTLDGSVVPAFEIMTVTPAIRNMIRENKIPQMEAQLYASARPDMVSMDTSILRLYQEKRISREVALTYATNPEMLSKKL